VPLLEVMTGMGKEIRTPARRLKHDQVVAELAA